MSVQIFYITCPFPLSALVWIMEFGFFLFNGVSYTWWMCAWVRESINRSPVVVGQAWRIIEAEIRQMALIFKISPVPLLLFFSFKKNARGGKGSRASISLQSATSAGLKAVDKFLSTRSVCSLFTSFFSHSRLQGPFVFFGCHSTLIWNVSCISI
jgi:hypothetical protein